MDDSGSNIFSSPVLSSHPLANREDISLHENDDVLDKAFATGTWSVEYPRCFRHFRIMQTVTFSRLFLWCPMFACRRERTPRATTDCPSENWNFMEAFSLRSMRTP